MIGDLEGYAAARAEFRPATQCAFIGCLVVAGVATAVALQQLEQNQTEHWDFPVFQVFENGKVGAICINLQDQTAEMIAGWRELCDGALPVVSECCSSLGHRVVDILTCPQIRAAVEALEASGKSIFVEFGRWLARGG
ncbi:MAG: hypothetical protein KBC64_04150 [Simkaniaceae bacterium]|nr:hypothetical protein [Simkaniaceae bacterium]